MNSDKRTLRWCAEHEEPAWVYDDGSELCWYDSIVEASNPHQIVNLPQDDEIERLRAERDDHKARLAVEAVTAPDADFDTMVDSLQARLCDLHAEVDRLRDEMSTMHRTVVHDCCVQVQSERRLADQLASHLEWALRCVGSLPLEMRTTFDARMAEVLAAHKEARRG